MANRVQIFVSSSSLVFRSIPKIIQIAVQAGFGGVEWLLLKDVVEHINTRQLANHLAAGALALDTFNPRTLRGSRSRRPPRSAVL